MWNKNKQSIISGDDSINLIAGRDIFFIGNAPTGLIDQKIEEEVEILRKSRFFSECDSVASSLRFGRRLVKGDLLGGSDELRGRALAWCARLLTRSDELGQAEEFLKLAIILGDSVETKLAEAFIISQKGDKAAAHSILADIESSASRSAALMVSAHHDGAEGALDWMKASGYAVGDLDSDGKCFLLNHQLQLGRWEEVSQTVGALSLEDFSNTPILNHLAALATLAPTIPPDFRAIVLTQVPFDAREFPLASDAVAMNARRLARQHFFDAVGAAKQLALPSAERVADVYTLWLELRDPAQTVHGRNRLEAKLRDPDFSLGVVHFALQYGIKLDLDAVERDIDRQIARNGGMTIEAAIARFALAFTQPTAEEAANYIARYYDQLASHIGTKLMRYRQIEMLSQAGQVEKANEILAQLVGEGIPSDQERNLRRIISEVHGSDPVESRKVQYETTNNLSDLISLVGELEDKQRWDDLCKFGRLLFEETRSLRDAERLVSAFNNTHRFREVVFFLEENSDYLLQSKHLRMSYAWGLYNEGAFLESRASLADLHDEVDNPNYRALQVNLGIATGDWASLAAYVADEYRKRDDRSAQDLIGIAQLALHLGSPQAKDLVFAAAKKANDDPAILAAAYFTATSAGWENDPQIFQWLEKASELSGENGPLQRMSLKDILDRKPEWDRRESETWRLLAQGQIPIFLAAQALNRTLIDLTGFPALANLTETDPRRRSAISAYSGKRMPLEVDIRGKSVALDSTALLTLSFLKILDVALDAFETIYIPHSMLGWLFQERQKAAFHQPSRIANAHKVRDLLATDVLYRFTPSTVANSDLSAQIGDELAALIAEAEKVREGESAQHIVIRSAPVHRLASLMEEEADLSAHTAVLSSCLAVVQRLKQKGVITADEEKKARAYLQLHEKQWPNQPEITDRATLYLDDLSISYFLHLGLLGKLKAAGLTAVVSPRELSETDTLITYERISEEVKDVIERIRATLNSRIESGHVKIGSMHRLDKSEDESISEHPSVGILALAPLCDISIIDDRFLNQHEYIASDGKQAQVLSTLDLLDALVSAGFLSDDERLEYRTRLRRAGYFFVPVCVPELERCLMSSNIAEGKVVETAELKAIRESVLRVRMSDWLRLPEEAPWLDGTLKAFVHVLRNLWVDGADIKEVSVRSDWLAEQIDVRGWAHSIVPENADNTVRIGRAMHILLLLAPPTGVQEGVTKAYWSWVEERILAPIQEQFPDVYEWLVSWYRNYFANLVERLLMGENNS